MYCKVRLAVLIVGKSCETTKKHTIFLFFCCINCTLKFFRVGLEEEVGGWGSVVEVDGRRRGIGEGGGYGGGFEMEEKVMCGGRVLEVGVSLAEQMGGGREVVEMRVRLQAENFA